MNKRGDRSGLGSGARMVVLFAVVLILLASGKTLLGIYTDWLWYTHDARQPEVFAKAVKTQAALWTVGLIVAFLAIYLNARVSLSSQAVYDAVPQDENSRAAANVLAALQKFARLLAAAAAIVVALGVASTLGGAYKEFWASTAAVEFGRKDPLFNIDIGFYVFKLPWFKTVADVSVAVLAIAFVLTLAGYLGTRGLAKVARVQLPQGAMRMHLSVLAGLGLMAFGARLYLMKYLMGVAEGPQFVGPGYAQSKVVQYYAVLGVATAVVGLLAMINGKAGKPWRALGFGVPLLLLAGLVLFAFVPGYIQQFTVAPNSLTLEPPFAKRAIESTRFAYGLDRFEVRDFAVKAEPTADEVKQAQSTLKSMRLWDPNVLRKVFDERQSLRPYYTFYDVDVDRYTIGGEQRMVMLAPRDISNNGLDQRHRSWQNQYLRYTHGFGVVIAPANESIDSGQPNYWLSNFPPVQGTLFPLNEQRTYFGHYPEGSQEKNGYVLLKTKLAEFDYPSDPEAVHNWTGDRGIPISGALAKFAFSTLNGDIKFYTTKDITAESRLVFHRDIIDRASKVYPFLSFDSDPYIALIDGRVVWIIDAYTVSDMVPYSDFTNGINYVRNSVKITVDAYSGDMRAYAIEEDEPVLRAWMKVFPGLIRPGAEVPDQVREHFRYAEGLFAAQSEVMAQYHVTDPVKFLSNEDAWQVSLEIGADGLRKRVEPYYVHMRVPGETQDGFMLIRPFSPNERNNMIGWMAAHCDPENYGRVTVFRFPRDTQTQGPYQMESKFNQDPIVADINRQFNNDQSSIVPGNLLVIPVGSSLLYVKPLFLESRARPIPELRKVVLGLQNRVVVGNTYEEALEKLFGQAPRQSLLPSGVEDLNRPTVETADKQAVREALQLLDQADAALRLGDFAKYGELQRQAREKLRGLAQ